MPSVHISIISLFSMSLSNTSKFNSLIIPAGSDFDFITCTFFLFLKYVGQAPLFIISTVPWYKSTIAISSVAKISSFLFIKLVFINSNDVSLSKPDINRFSNIFSACLLLSFAFSPAPIPSLIATRYFPSLSLVFIILSPDTSFPAF